MNLLSGVKSLGITLSKHQVVQLQRAKSCLCSVIRFFTLRTQRKHKVHPRFFTMFGEPEQAHLNLNDMWWRLSCPPVNSIQPFISKKKYEFSVFLRSYFQAPSTLERWKTYVNDVCSFVLHFHKEDASKHPSEQIKKATRLLTTVTMTPYQRRHGFISLKQARKGEKPLRFSKGK